MDLGWAESRFSWVSLPPWRSFGERAYPKSSLLFLHNQEANQALGWVWEMAGGRRLGPSRALQGAEMRQKPPVRGRSSLRPAQPPAPQTHAHTHRQRFIPLAVVAPLNTISPAGSCPEPWPVSQQESPQTGARTLVPRPETTPDLSSWTGTGTEWAEKPSDQDSGGQAVR